MWKKSLQSFAQNKWIMERLWKRGPLEAIHIWTVLQNTHQKWILSHGRSSSFAGYLPMLVRWVTIKDQRGTILILFYHIYYISQTSIRYNLKSDHWAVFCWVRKHFLMELKHKSFVMNKMERCTHQKTLTIGHLLDIWWQWKKLIGLV